MTKRVALLALAFCLAFAGFTQTSFAQKGKKAPAAAGAVDKAYVQKIWDGWASLDPAAVKQYYAQGPHVFFDITPLKYASWDEYQAGVTKVFADYKSAKCRVNDDAQIHRSGDAVWITATVAYEMTHQAGKVDMGNFRWTAVFEKQDGNWLIVHEHVSEPL